MHDARFLSTSPQSSLVTERYRSKLDQKAQSEGLASIGDLKLAYADKIQQQRKRDAILHPLSIPQAPETPVTQPMKDHPLPKPETQKAPAPSSPEIPQAPETPVTQPNADRPDKPSAGNTEKSKVAMSLEDFIDVEKVKDLPEKELTAIWRLRHANSPNALCAVIPAPTYAVMDTLARTAPQFVIPVPHESQGAEIHFLQWTFDAASRTSTVLFTQLAEYKARGEFAQPHTTITHHLDFAGDKGLVLMQGHVVDDRGIQVEHAKWLIMCLQKFYGGWEAEGALTGERKARAEERRKLLEWFSTGDDRFSIEKLLEEAERMG